jgi:hypothetical protein
VSGSQPPCKHPKPAKDFATRAARHRSQSTYCQHARSLHIMVHGCLPGCQPGVKPGAASSELRTTPTNSANHTIVDLYHLLHMPHAAFIVHSNCWYKSSRQGRTTIAATCPNTSRSRAGQICPDATTAGGDHPHASTCKSCIKHNTQHDACLAQPLPRAQQSLCRQQQGATSGGPARLPISAAGPSHTAAPPPALQPDHCYTLPPAPVGLTAR